MARNLSAARPIDVDYESARAWLYAKPRVISVTMALRAALRSLPLLGTEKGRADFSAAVMLPAFRALIIGSASISQKKPSNFLHAAESAASGIARYADVNTESVQYISLGDTVLRGIPTKVDGMSVARRAAATIAYAAASVVSADTDAELFSAAAFQMGAIGAAGAEVTSSAGGADVQFIEQARTDPEPAQQATQLARRKLWPSAIPYQIDTAWVVLREVLLAANEGSGKFGSAGTRTPSTVAGRLERATS